jgi:hypothetical protein
MVEGQPIGIKKEKRQVERKYLVFYLRVFDGLGSKVIGHLVNISSNGAMLLSDLPILVNEEYKLRMRLPHELVENGEIILNATSRWCKRDTNPDFYLAGFQLHDISPTLKSNILSLIDEFSYKQESVQDVF